MSDEPKVDITPKMIEAGAEALMSWSSETYGQSHFDDAARRVFTAMIRAGIMDKQIHAAYAVATVEAEVIEDLDPSCYADS